MKGTATNRRSQPVDGTRAAGVRTVWSLLDQAVSSATSFVLLFLVVRSVEMPAVGAFGAAYAVYFLATLVVRGMAVEPLVVRCTTQPRQVWRRSVRAAMGQVVVLGLLMGAATVVAGVVAGGHLLQALVPLGLTMPGLVAQDAWRCVFLAERRPRAALANDVLRLVAQLGLCWLMAVVLSLTLVTLVAVWGGVACVCSVVAAAWARSWPRPGAALQWFRTHRRLSLGFTGDYLAQGGSQQVALALVGAVGGLGALGAISAARLLFAPLTSIQSGLNLLAIPEGARLRERNPAQLSRYAIVLATALALLMAAAGLVLLALPPQVGRLALGGGWAAARDLLVPMCVLVVATAAGSGFWVLLRVLESAKETFWLRSAFGITTIAAGTLGTALAGARGGVWGMAASAAGLCLGMAVVALRRSRRLRPSVAESARMVPPVPAVVADEVRGAPVDETAPAPVAQTAAPAPVDETAPAPADQTAGLLPVAADQASRTTPGGAGWPPWRPAPVTMRGAQPRAERRPRLPLDCLLVPVAIGVFQLYEALSIEDQPFRRLFYGVVVAAAVGTIALRPRSVRLTRRAYGLLTGFFVLSSVSLFLTVFQRHWLPGYIVGDFASVALPLILVVALLAQPSMLRSPRVLSLLAAFMLAAAVIAHLFGVSAGRSEPPMVLLLVMVWVPVLGRTSLRWRLVGVATALLVVYLAYMSGYRTHVGLWVAAAVLVCYLLRGIRVAATITAVTVAVAGLVVLSGQAEHLLDPLEQSRFRTILNDEEDFSFQNRLDEARDVVQTAEEQWFPGQFVVGGGFGMTYTQRRASMEPNINELGSIHSVHIGPVMVFFRYGLMGLTVLVALAVLAVRTLPRVRARVLRRPDEVWPVVAGVAAVLYLVDFLFRNSLVEPTMALSIAALLYLWCARDATGRAPGAGPEVRPGAHSHGGVPDDGAPDHGEPDHGASDDGVSGEGVPTGGARRAVPVSGG